MFTKLLEGVDRALVTKLVILHTLVIAVSNYLVTIRFDLFPGADLPLFGSFPLAAAAFTFPIVVVATDLTVRMVGKEAGRAVVALAIIPAILASVLVLLALDDPHAYSVGFASGTAYAIGTMLDVYVFQAIRERSNAWWQLRRFQLSRLTLLTHIHSFMWRLQVRLMQKATYHGLVLTGMLLHKTIHLQKL